MVFIFDGNSRRKGHKTTLKAKKIHKENRLPILVINTETNTQSSRWLLNEEN